MNNGTQWAVFTTNESSGDVSVCASCYAAGSTSLSASVGAPEAMSTLQDYVQ
jgi:hypothetical protein